MGRPEIDVSATRLKMRTEIECEIAKVVNGCGFHRVKLNLQDGEKEIGRTAWNRSLHLYERIAVNRIHK